MKALMVAGESSGDAHGAALMAALKKHFSPLTVYGIGGPLMLQQGLQPYYTMEALRVHGLVELLPHLPRLYKILWHLRDSLLAEQPDFAILIDYPGFNLKLAAHIKHQNIPLFWFSSPQVWAWRAGRIHKIAQFVDEIFVLFPFEEAIYQEVGMKVHFVGHPCLEDSMPAAQIQQFKEKHRLASPVIALALGSRPSELKHHLPIVLEAIALLKNQGMRAQYILPVAESLDKTWVERCLQDSAVPIVAVQGAFMECVHAADLAIVASGTATLQTGLASTPFVIIYKVSHLTYWLARFLSPLPHLGMVNILAQRLIVPELLQQELTPANLAQVVLKLWNDVPFRQKMVQDLSILRSQLGTPGAYARTAQHIETFVLKSTSPKNAPL